MRAGTFRPRVVGPLLKLSGGPWRAAHARAQVRAQVESCQKRRAGRDLYKLVDSKLIPAYSGFMAAKGPGGIYMGNLQRTTFYGGQWAHKAAPQGKKAAYYHECYKAWADYWRDYLKGAGGREYDQIEGEQRRLLDRLYYDWKDRSSRDFTARLAAYHALLDMIYENFQQNNVLHEAEAAEYRRVGI